MKDPTDLKTADMHPPAPKKRGRPATGSALTAAERKRNQRNADRERLECFRVSDGKPVTVTGLIEAVARAARLGLPDLLMEYAQQLADRIREQKAAAKKP